MAVPRWQDLSRAEQDKFIKLALDYFNLGFDAVSYKNYGLELREGKTEADIEELCGTHTDAVSKLALALVSVLEFGH